MEPSYTGQNGKIDAFAVAWLFAEDHVFFNEEEITWDGRHHGIAGAQINAENIEEIPEFMGNANVYFGSMVEMLNYIESDESLRVPRESIHEALHDAIRVGDLTGLTLFNLMACARSFKFVTSQDGHVRQDMIEMAGLENLFSADNAEDNTYVVMADNRLTRGIPGFYSLIKNMVARMRLFNGKTLSFVVLFANVRNIDADQCLGQFDDMVSGACSEAIHVETSLNDQANDMHDYGEPPSGGPDADSGAVFGSATSPYENLVPGDTLNIGTYETEKDGSKSSIPWTVLSASAGRALIISDNIIDYKPFNDDFAEIGWRDCSLRKWLNDSFSKDAFSQEEKSWIIPSEVATGVTDKIFILNADEAKRLFHDDRKRSAAATPFASDCGTSGRWWTRTSSDESGYVINVSRIGLIRDSGDKVSLVNCGVRPAMYISIGGYRPEDVEAAVLEDDDWAWVDSSDDPTIVASPQSGVTQYSDDEWDWADDAISGGGESQSQHGDTETTDWCEDGRADEASDEDRAAIISLLRLLVLTSELGGNKTKFPQEMLEELDRVENGDTSVDLQNLAERMNSLVPDPKSADLSNISFESSNVAVGRRFSIIAPDGWTILKNYVENSPFGEQIRPFVIIQGDADGYSDLSLCDRVIYSSIAGDIEPDDAKEECGIAELNWALHWYNAYDRSDESFGSLKPVVVWDTEIEAINTRCFVTQHEVNDGANDLEFDVYPYANDHMDSLRFVFNLDENTDIEAIRKLVLDMAKTVHLDEPAVPKCEKELAQALSSSLGAESFSEMCQSFAKPFVAMRQMIFDAAEQRYASSTEEFNQDDCTIAGAYGITTLCNRAVPILERLLDAYDTQVEIGTSAQELSLMLDALSGFEEIVFPKEDIFDPDDAELIGEKGVFNPTPELKSVRQRLGGAVAQPGCKTNRTSAENPSSEVSSEGSTVPCYQAKRYQLGEIVELGSYPCGANGNREILKWKIIDIRGSHAMALSVELVDCRKFDEDGGQVTWESSSIRKWLNNDFANEAFSTEERKRVSGARLANPDNPEYGTPGCGDTKDRVFLLSIDEAEQLLPIDDERCAEPTEYAESCGANQFWWLRSPGLKDTHAAYVGGDGKINKGGSKSNLVARSIRPALFLKTES